MTEVKIDAKDENYESIIRKIYEEEYIGQHIGVTTLSRKYNYSCFYDAFRKFNLPVRDNRNKNLKYTCNSHYFDIIDNEEKAYWLGFIYADGYLQSKKQGNNRALGISLAVQDINHLKKFKECIEFTGKIYVYTVAQGYGVGNKYARIIIRDPVLTNALIKAGCVEHKTDILKFPNELILSKKYRKDFIRGYFDGDGSIHFTGGQYKIRFCGTDDILDGIMQDLYDNHVITRIYPKYKRKEGQIVSNFDFGGNYLVQKYCHYIYNNASIYLDRKYKIAQGVDDEIFLMKQIKKERKVPHECAICGDINSHRYLYWHGNGIFNGKPVCNKHYIQLCNGKIIPDKKDACEICGNNTTKLTRVGMKYPDYYGITLCKSHYDYLCKHNKLKEGAIRCG